MTPLLTQYRPMSDAPHVFVLQPHPATPVAPTRVAAVQAHLRVEDGCRLQLRYTLTGDVAALLVPPRAAQPAATDGLWKHTCFELFIGHGRAPAYREFNFSPSGDWAVYDFNAERVRAPQPVGAMAPRIACTVTATALQLDVDLTTGAEALASADALIGLTAVLESQDGALSYWAVQHPCAQPDFHHRGGWVVPSANSTIHNQIGCQRCKD